MRRIMTLILSISVVSSGIIILYTEQKSNVQTKTGSIVDHSLHPKYIIKKGGNVNSHTEAAQSSGYKGGIQNLPNVNLNKPVEITEIPYSQGK
ncbi:hypothetical protein GMB86_07345 [Terrilactibacillus sp. BCM23-1]|uniref:Uncharacterized protein n=1 Tax=Terrilactibacillus tamarindi TaxID=2599694 RepID=A0A6N8CRY0_9BACI|nr:hypothetical protein [Terrilactibacillus tamarindi]MTT31823.1 hypothetical protein [Terrilactibacillus tamarindi]